ncbi:MAG: hypothetical protein HYU69_00025 [Bacteroidetes bacterium]|nr:hypothetical protein [Bacteroidota bacterium]
MSKLNHDPLFRLIKSLTKSEKRYFKLYVSRHLIKDFSHYITLFDAIENQENYSEKDIYKDLSGVIKNIPSTKYHLYQKILESLELFDKGKQIDSVIMQGIGHITILINKSMYEDAYSRLLRIKKTAYTSERFELILYIAQLERRILLRYFINRKQVNSRIFKLLEEEKNIHRLLSTENEYKQLAHKVEMHMKEKGNELRSGKEKKLFDDIIRHPLMNDETITTTSFSKKLKYFIFQNYYFLIGDHAKAGTYALKGLALIETKLNKNNKQEVAAYIDSIGNLLLDQILTKNHIEALNTIKKIKSIPSAFNLKETDDAYIKVIQYGYIEELSLLNHMGQLANGMTAGNQFLPTFLKFKNKMAKEYLLVFIGNYAYTCFGVGYYKESLHWINELFNLPKEMFREDIMISMKILNLINNFELKNYDHLEYMNLAAQRYFKKQKKVYKVESIIVSFIQNYAKINTNEELSEFKKLKVKITKALKSPYESSALDPFDIISWIDSKIKNKTFAEMVKEKMRSVGS